MADRIADVDERLGTWLPYNWTTFNPCGQIPDEIIVRPKKYGVVDTLIFDIDGTSGPSPPPPSLPSRRLRHMRSS